MSEFKPGWAEAAGKAAAEEDRAAKRAVPAGPRRHYIPVLPAPQQQQKTSALASTRRHFARKEADRNLEQVLGRVEE